MFAFSILEHRSVCASCGCCLQLCPLIDHQHKHGVVHFQLILQKLPQLQRLLPLITVRELPWFLESTVKQIPACAFSFYPTSSSPSSQMSSSQMCIVYATLFMHICMVIEVMLTRRHEICGCRTNAARLQAHPAFSTKCCCSPCSRSVPSSLICQARKSSYPGRPAT